MSVYLPVNWDNYGANYMAYCYCVLVFTKGANLCKSLRVPGT